ncbi:hypothetical protein HLH17_02075 [Acinetobacter sp. ANC 5380]|uniref:Uncharacterized protein n=1 Tax=Acinetobacter terrae TaxID=2731247 RepID=A0A7Y2W9R1_9GAMM|nr:hypothetical protein [Acinetobacter terrae]
MLTIGKDYDYVRNELDFPRVKVLNAYNKQCPPSHVGIQRLCRILEAFMGIEDSSGSDGSQNEDDLFADLQNFPHGG